MVPIYFRPLGNDEELRLGWPTWDPMGKNREMSIKFLYPRRDGKPSRASPEVSVHMAVEMVDFAAEHNQLTSEQVKRLRERLKKL